jgi:hypothetical protein
VGWSPSSAALSLSFLSLSLSLSLSPSPGSYHVGQTDLELTVLLLLPPEYWKYKHVLPPLAHSFILPTNIYYVINMILGAIIKTL